MRLVALLALLVACKGDPQATAKSAELVRAEADKETARIDMERQRAKVLSLQRISEELDAVQRKLETGVAEMQQVLDKAGTVDDRDLERRTFALEVLKTDAGKLRKKAATEEARIDALPATCFTQPSPPECELPAESTTKTGE